MPAILTTASRARRPFVLAADPPRRVRLPAILTTANRARQPLILAADPPRRVRLPAILTTENQARQPLILASGRSGRRVLVRHPATLDVDHTANAPAIPATPPPAVPPFPPAIHITAPKETLRMLSRAPRVGDMDGGEVEGDDPPEFIHASETALLPG